MASNQHIAKRTGRGQRVKRLSDKAYRVQEDGQDLPGILSSPLSSSFMASSRKRPKTLGEAIGVLTGLQRSVKKRLIEEPVKKPQTRAPDGRLLPTFSAETFQIYRWPEPSPRSLPKVTASHRAWKEEVDAKGLDIARFDDGADVWDEFAGNRDYYEDDFGLEFAVASSFKNRALRAHRTGVSWDRFESSEREQNSEAAARGEVDPGKRQLLLEEALDNDLRLAVFNQLKCRLRNEIWLEEDMPLAEGHDSRLASQEVSTDEDGEQTPGQEDALKLSTLTMQDSPT